MKAQLLVLAEEKKIDINFSEAKTKFCLILHYNRDNSYLFVNRKEIYKFKASNKSVNFTCQFCLRRITNKFDYVDSEEVLLKGNVYNFSVDYCSIDKSDVLNIHVYLISKNNIK